MVPLFTGLPGGPELLIVLLVMILVLGVPLVLVGAAAFFGVRYYRDGRRDAPGDRDGRDERITELEREVDELRARLDARPRRPDGPGADRPDAAGPDSGARRFEDGGQRSDDPSRSRDGG